MRIYVLALFAILTGCGEKAAEKPKEAPRLPKITHFYGNAAIVPKGESLTLCYGTENVETVTVTPSDDNDLRPSLNRCIAHTPKQDTTYILKASGPGGDTTASFSIRVGPAEPKGAKANERVMIQSFVILGKTPVAPGTRVQLCYTTEGATAVSVSPPAGSRLGTGLNQCFIVTPAKSTNYVLTATAGDGAVDRMQVSVAVQ